MSQESRDYAGDMYELEAQLQELDKHLWYTWEDETGQVWEELNNAQDWEQVYRLDWSMAVLMKQKLESYLLM